MKKLNELESEIEQGKVVFPLSAASTIRAYKDDIGQYVCRFESGYCTAESFYWLMMQLEELPDQGKLPRYVLHDPTWQALDTSISDKFQGGKTLFEFRHALLDGATVYSIRGDEVYGTNLGGLYYTSVEEEYSYETIDSLLAHLVGTHLPIWSLDKPPSHRILEQLDTESELEGPASHIHEDSFVGYGESPFEAMPTNTVHIGQDYEAIVQFNALLGDLKINL